MEGHCADAVGSQERLLHPIPMVDVNVDVQHARMVLEQLQDCQHYVVHIAEPARLQGGKISVDVSSKFWMMLAVKRIRLLQYDVRDEQFDWA